MINLRNLAAPRDCFPPLWCLTTVIGITRAEISRQTGISAVLLQRLMKGGKCKFEKQQKIVALLLKTFPDLKARKGESDALRQLNLARRNYCQEVYNEYSDLLVVEDDL